MNAFIVELDNRPGAFAKAAEAIAQKGINISGFAGVTIGGSGGVVLITNDEPGTRSTLTDAGLRFREIELVTVGIENRPGTIAEVVRKLADGGINIEASLAIGMTGDKVQVVFATSDAAKARSILGDRVMTAAMG
jgi:hypothetical protein